MQTAKLTFAAADPPDLPTGPTMKKKSNSPMVDILNLALPYFGPIFIGFACGKAKGLPEQGLARRHPDRARFHGGADRDLRLRHHAHQHDVVDANRPAGVSIESEI